MKLSITLDLAFFAETITALEILNTNRGFQFTGKARYGRSKKAWKTWLGFNGIRDPQKCKKTSVAHLIEIYADRA